MIPSKALDASLALPQPWLAPSAKWYIRDRPFRHVEAHDVFGSGLYEVLAANFRRTLADTRADLPDQLKFKPPTSSYDAWMVGLDASTSAAFWPLFDPSWLRYLAGALNLPISPLVDGALHHIPAGSRAGYIHTDFCSAWFDAANAGEDPRFPRRRLTEYFTGRRKTPSSRPVEYVRIATMIYYLANDGWRAGMGGETGLFATSRGTVATARPPINNSLLLFECSPHSYHALQANPKQDRNSVILWLHADVEWARARWGDTINRRHT